MDKSRIIFGDNRLTLKKLIADGVKVQSVITSPPYFGLRDYGTGKWEGGNLNCDHKKNPPAFDKLATSKSTIGEYSNTAHSQEGYKDICKKCGAKRIDLQIGLESTPEEYVNSLVEVFRLIWDVLEKDGTVWLNIGDSYMGSWGATSHKMDGKAKRVGFNTRPATSYKHPYIKPKDLIGIPWKLAFALQEDGWYLRSDIIWAKPNCLSGTTPVYIKSKGRPLRLSIREMYKLPVETLEIAGKDGWRKVLSIEKRPVEPLLVVYLRNGMRIKSTYDHLFPIGGKLFRADELKKGMVLESTKFLDEPKTTFGDEEIGWFIGLYLAEGSLNEKSIRFDLNADEMDFLEKLKKMAVRFNGKSWHTISGNNLTVGVSGRILLGILEHYVDGYTSKKKHLSRNSFSESNVFLEGVLKGYLNGDGCWNENSNRWRIGFTSNRELELDLRTICNRLGYFMRAKLYKFKCQTGEFPGIRGEIRLERSGHGNEKPDREIMRIIKTKGTKGITYEMSVDGDNLFCLADGTLVHNCLPESVTDRCTKSHEYIFLLTKHKKYYYNANAIKEPYTASTKARISQDVANQTGLTRANGGRKTNGPLKALGNVNSGMKNKRDVWWISPKPYKGSHFATFPKELVIPCVLAGSKKGDFVLDPFAGSGTVGEVAKELDRKFILLELNKDYRPLIYKRIGKILT